LVVIGSPNDICHPMLRLR